MIILGLNMGHDAGAALCRDGKIVAVALRERISRIKRPRGLDHVSIDTCLSIAGVDFDDIDYIALATAQRTEVQMIHTSTSWKITKPLRRISQALRGGKSTTTASQD